MITTEELVARIALLAVDGVGPIRCKRLLSVFGDAQTILRTPYAELRQVEDIGEQTALAIVGAHTQLAEAEKIVAKAEAAGFAVWTFEHPDYPAVLSEIPDSPIVLYANGALKPDWGKSIAIVGSRLATEYGKKVAYQLANDLSANGWTVVSGLAIGVDGAVHKGALAGMVGSTVAVLGCGLDVVYPPQHRELMAEIETHGLILSEYPPGIQPDARFFPQRNRIISGLTLGTVVVEAREKSGALLTADSALDQNRDLYAVPGMLTSPLSRGPHRLIQKGAKLVTCADDIIAEYHGKFSKREIAAQTATIAPEALPIMEVLQKSPLSADQLADQTGMAIGQLLAHLTDMQLKGLIITVGSEFHWNGGKL